MIILHDSFKIIILNDKRRNIREDQSTKHFFGGATSYNRKKTKKWKSALFFQRKIFGLLK